MPYLGLWQQQTSGLGRASIHTTADETPDTKADKGAKSCPRQTRGGAQRECSFASSLIVRCGGLAPVGSLTRIDMLHRYPSPGSATWMPSDMATFVSVTLQYTTVVVCNVHVDPRFFCHDGLSHARNPVIAWKFCRPVKTPANARLTHQRPIETDCICSSLSGRALQSAWAPPA